MDCAGGGTLNGESCCTGSYHPLRLARPAEDSSHHDCTCTEHSACACPNKRTLSRIPQRGLCAASVTAEYLELRDYIDSDSELTPILERVHDHAVPAGEDEPSFVSVHRSVTPLCVRAISIGHPKSQAGRGRGSARLNPARRCGQNQRHHRFPLVSPCHSSPLLDVYRHANWSRSRESQERSRGAVLGDAGQAPTTRAGVNGGRRSRRPVAANTALATAAAMGGVEVSPVPVGGLVDGTMCTSMSGI